MTVRVTIDRLVLDGLSRREGPRIAAALEHRLQYLIARDGPPHAIGGGATAKRLDAGNVEAAAPGTARAIGDRLAETIYRGARG